MGAPPHPAGTDLAVTVRRELLLVLALLVMGAGAGGLDAQRTLTERLERVDRAEAAVLVALGRASGPTLSDADLSERLTRFVQGEAAPDAPEGGEPAVLGARAAEILARGRAFRREVIAILADRGSGDPSAALDAAVRRYRSEPQSALPTAPKNMDVLYDHDSALTFRTSYPQLNGFLWAGQWLRLATTEPLADIPDGAERQAGVDTVAIRYLAKLSGGEPPQAYPSELPLAPAIAPGLIWLSPETAMIWDNLSLFTEVIADILAASGTTELPAADVPAAIEATVDFFVAPEMATTEQMAWELMALRHGIFFQGGYPLAVMTRSELNGNSHAMHMRRGGPMVIPGMIGR